jgi:hypothetical protein
VSWRPIVAGLSVCGLVLASAVSAVPQSPSTAAQADTEDTSPGIPKFYAESRQILIEATVSDRDRTDSSWIPQDVAKLPSAAKDFFTMHPPVRGLRAADFRVFENGVQQKVNYFTEADFPGANLTHQWAFLPESGGTWGLYSDAAGLGLGGVAQSARVISLAPPAATYLIGYVPPALKPGECRTIRVTAGDYYVSLNRQKYCASKEMQPDEIAEAKRIGAQMGNFAGSRKTGSIPVSLQAFTFWSSGVLSLMGERSPDTSPSETPSGQYKYVVEVHDAKAPATIQVAAGFPGLGGWPSPCPKDNSALYVLAVAYKSTGDPAKELWDRYPCRTPTSFEHPGLNGAELSRVRMQIPSRFDAQMELWPGDYDLHVVVSDGKEFGQARMPLHVQPLDPQRLMISDVVLAGVVRYAGWVLLEAAALTPAPVIPSPLVSRDSQYFPDSDKEILLHKHTPLYFYFEIYEPQFGTPEKRIYYRWRITNQKSGAVVLNSEPISANLWIVPGSAVVPIGLKVDADKLPKGNYKLEMQASDSAGQMSEWRASEFRIK